MRIKNWDKYQNFKDRRPPWIKLHRELLDDKEFHELPGTSVKVLIFLWLLASEDETKQGSLPSVKKIAFRLRMTDKSLESIVSTLDHWLIQDAPILGTTCHQLGPSETETETYTKETETYTKETERCAISDFETFWTHYPKKVGKKEACKAWGKVKDKPALSIILEALIRSKGSDQWLKDNGQFIPNPSTWLNQGRWDDVLTVKPLTTMEAFLNRKDHDEPRRIC